MFDASYAISNLKNNGSLWAVVDGSVAISLFLFTWLIGGGALISSIITTMQENHHGAWRKWRPLVWNHTLIIGWNDNAPTVIRQHLEACRMRLVKTPWGVWQPKRPERIIIITAGDAYAISKVVESTIGSFLQRIRVTHDVYCGSYDDVKERKRLVIERANAIYVLGDIDEPAHDARVSLWPTLIRCDNRFLKQNLYCALNIESYGLFCQQQRKMTRGRGASCRLAIDLNTFNFYDSWAKRLFARLDIKGGGKHIESTSRVTIKNPGPSAPSIVIVGFSEMGQAILAEVARDCHYVSNDNVLVTVIDEHLSDKYAEFKSIYPRIDEIADIDIDWVDIAKLGSGDFLSTIGRLADEDRQTTIIVANDDPAVAVQLALPIMNKMTTNRYHVRLLVRQEVRGLYNNWRVTNKTIGGEQQQFMVWGMRDGAGFGARRRDEIVKAMMCSRPGIGIQSCRQRIDALGQILPSLGIEVWFHLPTMSNRRYKPVFRNNVLSRKLTNEDLQNNALVESLLKAYHKHWCACYLLSDDGCGIQDRDEDRRLVKFESLKDDPQCLSALYDEVGLMLNGLREVGLHLVVPISYTNPYMGRLKTFAHEQGTLFLGLCNDIRGTRYVLGGALGYDAALAGNYDIDLRLLVPDAGRSVEEVRREIDSVKDLLAARAKGDPTFKTKFIDEGGTNYIWHTKQIVKVPGIPGDPDVELTWNIQAESTYRSIAEMAARLPKEVIDRYVIAKWNAQQAGKDAYKLLKNDWKSMINLLIDRGARKMDDKSLRELLDSITGQYPEFLKEGE